VSYTMAKVVAKIKVMPKDPEIKPNMIKKQVEKILPEGAEITASGEQPIAFGLVALMLNVAVPEESGTKILDAVQEAIESLEDVESTRVEAVTRISL